MSLTDAETLVRRLLSDAGMFEYRAGKAAGESCEYWLKRAPEFVMPEGVTRGV